MTDPSLFTPHEPQAPAPTPAPVRPRRSPRTAVVLGVSLVALLIVGGSSVALLASDSDGGEAQAAQVDLAADFSAFGEPDLLADTPPGPPAPAPAADPGRKPEAGGPLGLGGRGRGLGDDRLIVGTVVSTADGSIVLTSDSGGDRTIRTNGDTRVRGAAKAPITTLKAGERVVIRVNGSGDAATAVTIVAPRPRVAGTVTQIAGDVATIKKVDGTTEAANIAAVNPKPAVGDLVVIAGKSTDGTTITADRIRVLPKAS